MVDRMGLKVAPQLAQFIEEEALSGLEIQSHAFWRGTADILRRFAPENARLLTQREAIQRQLDQWYARRRNKAFTQREYQTFLREIGYLVDEPEPFSIETQGIDDEVARTAGPQLVVPSSNGRFVLNAANARWGSLYDALYGTNAVPGEAKTAGYDAARGKHVIRYAREFLDVTVPGWQEALIGVGHPSLVGRRGDSLLFRHNGLHLEVVVDHGHAIGRTDPLGIADIVVEAALTTIVDLEDSIAAVDAGDKVAAYRNWLGVVRGDLEVTFEKSGRAITRRLEPDRNYRDLAGVPFTLPGRSLLFVRNVGHLMSTTALLLPDGKQAPEGILDAIVTSLCGMHDLRGLGRFRNSRAGSIYIVKPKMHGPDEARFTNRLFDAVEDLLGLARHTIKMGLMDEERRTSVNLASCIHEVRGRLAFINTGFLDRTADEIHTSIQAGAMVPKGEMKSSRWLKAYETRNVQIGLACGLSGKAQIGKGMWAAPDEMAEMLKQKITHPQAGANTAWVPSPTAATLHALHYHQVDVFAVQEQLKGKAPPSLNILLELPLLRQRKLGVEEIEHELNNNAQGILGYVVRWIDQGIGCSKVPDINDIGLMEDRATLRISSQAIANWLLHEVCTVEQVEAAFVEMAKRVDAQNAHDPLYRPITPDPDASLAFQAARALVFEGLLQANGYTEPLLHRYRMDAKRNGQAHA